MSRTPVEVKPPSGLELSHVPTIKGKRAAWEWINNVLGVPMTMNYIVVNTNRRKIRRVMIGGALYFSTQDLFDFVMSHREQTP
ncbi:hypothetical protein KL864_28810 [Mycolicibacterium goodii]|uniref:hypothetical protein n=1 Tax=Mycolicibacterium goodii TaxID=134601 RepID=UPI001BDC2D8C|nr:hypothetical protein [Mycolicibacterium goodii]MBU8819891.1 hypothetical protein [Mycolicibacterium goodii]